MKKSHIKIIAMVLVSIMLMTGFVGCKNGEDSGLGKDELGYLDNSKASETEVVKIGDEMVYLDEVNLYALQYAYAFGIDPNTITSSFSQTQTYDEYFKEQLLSQLREAKIEYLVSQKEGITLTDEQLKSIDLGVTNFMAAMDADMLSFFGITKDLVTKAFTEQMYNQALEATVEYEGGVEEYQITTIHYLTFLTVETDEKGQPVTDEEGNLVKLDDTKKEEIKSKAEEALAKIKDGEDIDAVAKEYGIEETSGEQSGVYGTLIPEMNEEIDKLKNGEISPVFESDYGYNILKLIEIDNKEAAEGYSKYYTESKKAETLAKQQEEWFKSVEIDIINDLVGDTWEKFSFVPIGTWFDKLGIIREQGQE